jgi:membrane-bound metal-dependent hydrolase YbcI (DUF457 family)
MTEVGHFLMGATIGVLSMPRSADKKHRIAHIAAFLFLAVIPDLPFKGWGHDRYYFSHSLFVTLLLILLVGLAFLFLKELRSKLGDWPVLIGGALAWLSHLLLDSFYNQGKGIMIYWPFSEARLALPIPWFGLGIGSPIQIAHVLLIEFISYFPLLLLAILLRQKWDRWNSIP